MENKNPYTDKLNRWSSHIQISRMLEGLPEGARVLDVGAGSGTIARLCEKRGYKIYGIEPNAVWLGETKNLYSDIFSGTLEQVSDEYISSFDAVICGDVLEHLLSPERQIYRLVNLQSNSCLFIISVPNIANIWIRMNLLLGRFEYADRGIMDRTHLHFFTRKTFKKLLLNTGLNVIELIPTPIPLDLVTPFFSNTLIGKAVYAILGQLTFWWPTMLGYQWIAKTKKTQTLRNG